VPTDPYAELAMLEHSDVHRIARYVTGAGTPDERATTAEWIAALAERRALADDFARILTASPSAIPHSDTESAVARFRASVTPPTGAEASRHTTSNPRFQLGSLGLLRSLTMSAAAAVLVVAAMRETSSLIRRSPLTPARTPREYAAAIGERVSLTLTDGTQVELAPASRLIVPTTYGTSGRSVVLQGEANFSVVHNAAQPFSVRAANAVTTDLGTTFDVRAYANDPDVRVAVSEGQVALSVAGRSNAQTLGPRDVGTIDRSGLARVKRSLDPTAFTAWTNGDLVYRDVPASVVIADLWRWYAIDVQAPESALRRRVTMHFTHDESVSQVSAVLRGLLGNQVTIRALGDPNQADKEPAQSGGESDASQ
jgi:ferric-dicitrate binding protein FerR (iron transport regulator)